MRVRSSSSATSVSWRTLAGCRSFRFCFSNFAMRKRSALAIAALILAAVFFASNSVGTVMKFPITSLRVQPVGVQPQEANRPGKQGERPPSGWFSYAGGQLVSHVGLPRRDQFAEVILSVSYPRSGSTFLYKLLEEVTGVHGCAVYDEVRNVAFFGGKQVEDVYELVRTQTNARWLGPGDNCIAKTHYPYFPALGLDAVVKPSRLIVLVRNPVDTVLSMWDYERKKKMGESTVIELAQKYQLRASSPCRSV